MSPTAHGSNSSFIQGTFFTFLAQRLHFGRTSKNVTIFYTLIEHEHVDLVCRLFWKMVNIKYNKRNIVMF